MNWTGGGLSRSRDAKGSLSAKQKSYFAKVRGQMQNGRLPRPEIQTFELGKWRPTITMKDPPRSENRPVRRPSSQRTLEDFENVRPVVRKLSTLQPRGAGKRNRSPLQVSESQANQREGNASNPIVIGSGQSHLSQSSSRSQQADEPQRRRISSADITDNMTIEAKRQRLLEMNDWVGVGMQRAAVKPVKMTFADPTDRDLIGRRRKMSNTDHLHSNNRLPVSRRRPMVGQNHTAIPNAYDQHYTVDDVSVRIGSAVDRSMREGTAKSSRGRREQDSAFSDELLDNAAPASVHKASPLPIPANNRSVPVFSQLSDYGHRDVLTPSAFMDGSSKDHAESSSSPSQPIKSPTRVQDRQSDVESEVKVPIEQPPNGFRLVFESSPYRHPSSPKLGSDCPRICDFATNQDVVAPAELPKRQFSASDSQDVWGASKHRNLNPSDWSLPTPSRITARNLVQRDQGRKLTSDEQLEYGTVHEKERPERRRVNDTLQADTGFRSQFDIPQIVYQPEKRPLSAQDEDSVWRNFTTLHKQDNAPSNSQWNERLPTIDRPPAPPPLLSKSNENATPKASEDEEAAWRKIVFGDDSSDSGSQQSQNQDPNYQKYACTQPSLIAEAATSPLKQNPHLADDTFDQTSLSSYLSEASSTLAPPHFETSRSASEICATASPQRGPSLGANGSGSAATAHPPIEPWHQQLTHSSLFGQASSSSSHPSPHPSISISSDELQRSPDRVPFLPPVTAAAAGNGNTNHTHRPNQEATIPPIMIKIPPHHSQHPLNPPPAQPPHRLKPQAHLPPQPRAKEKIIYKPPPRYSSPIAPAPPPTVLGGRILRSGRTMVNQNQNHASRTKRAQAGRKGKGIGQGRGRKGRKGAAVLDDIAEEREQEHWEEDEIIDD